jgi:hypothetical protein
MECPKVMRLAMIIFTTHDCLYVSIFSRMFISSFFFFLKGYEATLLKLDNPLCVEAFCLPKESDKFFFWLLYFTFFKTRYTIRKYKVLKLGLQLGFLIATNTCNS